MSEGYDLSQALDTFMEDAGELLAQMEQILLRAETSVLDAEDLHALFRCAHTIKGSGGLFGLDQVVQFTHVVESVLDRLRNGELRFDRKLISLLLQSQDHISLLIAAVRSGEAVSGERGATLVAGLQQALGGQMAATPPPAGPELTASGGGDIGSDHWHLSLRFGRQVFQDGMDPLSFINYLNQYGSLVHVATLTDDLPDFAGADPELCYLGFEVALSSSATKAELESVFEFVRDSSTILIFPPHSKVEEYLRQIDALHGDAERLGEILVACGSVTAHELEQALTAQRGTARGARIGDILIEQQAVEAEVVDAAVGRQKRMDDKRSGEAKSVKVPAERLDALIDRVGELVIAGAGTHLQISRLQQPGLQEAADQLLALVEDIRDMALRLRMVAIGEVFARFPRVVRDVAMELGKDIELKISGAEAELDKSIVEKISDPLTHLVRNAMDHGIEAAEVRVAQGKPARGTVELNAYHESGSINIEVRDDGAGLARERILNKAIALGMASAGEALSDQEIYRFILAPGFSTAEKLTNLSGRGVGMDVVHSSIAALRGTLDIDSQPGQGTTMRLCLPLTLAIIDGFHVGIGHAHYIIPLDMVIECIELPPEIGERNYLELREEALPFVRLRRLFGEQGPTHPRPRVIVVQFGSQRAGLVVDRIVGKCQTVIKPLGPLFAEVPGVSGSTIVGSGEVGLILDVPALIRHCSHAGQRRVQHHAA